MFIFFLKFTYGERAQCASNARVTLGEGVRRINGGHAEL